MPSEKTLQAPPAVGPAALNLSHLKPGLLGKLFYHLIPIRRGVILRNLRQVFGESQSPGAIRRLAQCFYEHALQSMHENLAMLTSSERLLLRQVRIEGQDNLRRAAAPGKGVLILTGHFGNWEFAPLAALLQFKQYQHRFHFIRTAIRSDALEKMFFSRFKKWGLGVIEKKDAVQRVLELLSHNDAVVFVMDQHAGISRRIGIAVEFFGRRAGTNRSLALIARYSGATVVPATSWRERTGRHVLKFCEPLEWIPDPDPEREIYLNTRNYNRVLEQFVLDHPDQYFWLHRRWRIH